MAFVYPYYINPCDESLPVSGQKKMDSKKKHPFAITCRQCGSNSVAVYAFEYHDLEIRCKNCGNTLHCGVYHTDKEDYSDC